MVFQEAEGYLFHSENFNLPEGSAYNMINKDIELKNIDIGSKIALEMYSLILVSLRSKLIHIPN